MTVQEAAGILGVTERTVRQWISIGKLPAAKVQVGNTRKWSIDAVSVKKIQEQPESSSFHSEGQPEDIFPVAQPEVPGVQPEDLDFHPELPVAHSAHMEISDLSFRVQQIEAILSGQAISAIERMIEDNAALREELAQARDEAREREEKHQEELVALRQEVQTERVQQREQMKAIQEALKPWWKRWFGREKNENE